MRTLAAIALGVVLGTFVALVRWLAGAQARHDVDTNDWNDA